MRQVQCENCHCVMDMVGSFTKEISEVASTSSGRSGSQGYSGSGVSFSFGKNGIKPRFRVGGGRSTGRSYDRTTYRSRKIYYCQECARAIYQNYGDPGTLIVNKSKSRDIVPQLTVETNDNLNIAFNTTTPVAQSIGKTIGQQIVQNVLKGGPKVDVKTAIDKAFDQHKALCQIGTGPTKAQIERGILGTRKPRPEPVPAPAAKNEEMSEQMAFFILGLTGLSLWGIWWCVTTFWQWVTSLFA